jgi:co-chaperonin GroES (HSP10)
MTNIQPLGSLVLVKEISVEEKTTKSGLVLTASTIESGLTRGTIVKVGPGDHDNSGNHYPIPLKEGDVVIYSDVHGTEVEDEDREKYYFINWRSILGIQGEQA